MIHYQVCSVVYLSEITQYIEQNSGVKHKTDGYQLQPMSSQLQASRITEIDKDKDKDKDKVVAVAPNISFSTLGKILVILSLECIQEANIFDDLNNFHSMKLKSLLKVMHNSSGRIIIADSGKMIPSFVC